MSLSEKIALLSDPTPIFRDPEDDLNHETAAKVVDFQASDEDSDEFGQKSLLRLRNEALLVDQDQRYAGKKISRQHLQHSASSGSSSDDEDDEPGDNSRTSSDENTRKADTGVPQVQDDLPSESESNDDHSASQTNDSSDDGELLNEFKKQLTKSASSNIIEKSEADDETSSYDDEGDSSEHEVEDGTEENSTIQESLSDNTVQTFSNMHLDEEIDKGFAIKSQLHLWDSLLECRIKLQKVILSANQLPQFDVWPAFCEKGGSDFKNITQSCQESVKQLLDSFIELQSVMLAKNPETKHLLQPGNLKLKLESDEDIPSDTEDDDSSGNNDAMDAENMIGMKRKLKVSDYPEFLKRRHTDFEGFRNATIQKWNDKTKIASGKVKKSFESFEQSTVMQIEQILCDKDRLIRRTQLKRSNYELLGKHLCLEMTDGEGHTVSGQEAVLKQDFHLKDHDPEIFDDNDFYHHLLRELIEHKTMDVQDPIALGRQWLEIQKLRSKMKRKVDTRASKGRKIRYDIHPKLVNFMAPVDDCSMTEESRNDLFNSLFGRRSQNLIPTNLNAT